MSEELKPCPFCGCTDVYSDTDTCRIFGERTGHNYAVACSNCESVAIGSETLEEAIAGWNTRADLLPVVKPLVWRLVEERTSFARCRYVADTFIIEHRLHGEHFDLFLRPSATAATRFDTLEAAKDAAQADYEARIRDCLDMTDPADEINRLRAQLAAAEADKLAFGERVRDAATDACANVIKNYDVLKPDGKTYEPIRVQKAAKGMVSLAREDIRALDLDALAEGDQ